MQCRLPHDIPGAPTSFAGVRQNRRREGAMCVNGFDRRARNRGLLRKSVSRDTAVIRNATGEMTVRKCSSILLSMLVLLSCDSPEQMPQMDISTQVSVIPVGRESIEEFVSSAGTAIAAVEALLQSETAGAYRLAENPRTGRPFAVGDRIGKGQAVIYLDNAELENSIQIDSKKIELDLSKSEFEKNRKLYDMGGVTQRELTNSEKNYINAKYLHDNALIQRGKMKITAPFDGIIVGLPYYTAGVKIEPGVQMLHIMDYTTLVMNLELPGKLLGRIQPNQPVRVSNYTNPGLLLSGRITQVSPVLNPEGRTFEAAVEISNPGLVLRPGMFVKADVVVSRKDSTIVIPKDAILLRNNSLIVFTADRGAAVERTIRTGIENHDVIEVLDGLNAGDLLIIRGFETLRGRSRVTVIQ